MVILILIYFGIRGHRTPFENLKSITRSIEVCWMTPRLSFFSKSLYLYLGVIISIRNRYPQSRSVSKKLVNVYFMILTTNTRKTRFVWLQKVPCIWNFTFFHLFFDHVVSDRHKRTLKFI